VAPLPLLPSVVGAGLPLAEFGTEAQKQAWLPAMARGDAVLSVALAEPVNDDPTTPTTTATPTGDGWTLSGTKLAVEFADAAARVLVTAATPDGGVLVALVDPRGPGVTLAAERTTRKQTVQTMVLDGASVGADDVLGSPAEGRAIAEWIVERVLAALCAVQLGVTETQLRMTAEYTSTREQFGRPIATFQAVAQRAADAYINVEGIRLTCWQALWRLGEGRPAGDQVRIAKYWASDAAQQVAHAAQHLHGGIGMDVDYPLHRYTLWNKQIELTLGGGTQQLRTLGAQLAAS
jgi:alkylation response protein AidB-like acyl-CoA dehydrogenase